MSLSRDLTRRWLDLKEEFEVIAGIFEETQGQWRLAVSAVEGWLEHVKDEEAKGA